MADPQLLPGTILADDAGTLYVNVRGARVPTAWPGAGYAPRPGDEVHVLILAGAATIIGPIRSKPLPLSGTVSGSASAGRVPVSTITGVESCQYVGAAPTIGSLVRLDWTSTSPWVWPGAVAAAPPPPIAPPVTPTPEPPPPIASGVVDAPALDSASWRSDGGWGRSGNEVRQWRYGSEADSRGAWFYGDPWTAARGRTVTRARIYLPDRVRIGSYNAALTAHLYLHPHGGRPGGDVTRLTGPTDVTLAPIGGPTGWVVLPAIWGQTLADTGGGISLYGSPYLGLVGVSTDPQSGRIILDWKA